MLPSYPPSPRQDDFSDPIREMLAPVSGIPARTELLPSGLHLPPWFIDRCRQAYMAVPPEAGGSNRVIGVTSARSGDGKTSIAIGVATAIAADTQEPTVLFECDFERPSLYRLFGFDRDGGVGEWLEGTGRLRVIRSGIVSNCFIVPAGAPKHDPARLFHRLAESDAISGLRTYFPNVVIDLPPVMDIASSAMAQKLTNHILMVARVGRTNLRELEQAVFLLGQDRLSGIILNGSDPSTPAWLRSLL